MKKLILFLVLVLSSVAASAQLKAPLSDANLAMNYTVSAKDTATLAAPWAFTFDAGTTFSVSYNFKLKVSEVSATTSSTMALQGRKFASDGWTTITTVTYKGTGTDTTAYYSQESTKQHWVQYRMLVTPATGKLKIDSYNAILRK